MAERVGFADVADEAVAATNPDGDALSADTAQITGNVVLNDKFTATGEVHLVGVSAGGLIDDEASWPEWVRLEGFAYKSLTSRDSSWKVRRKWLRRQVEYHPVAYAQLAVVYRATGNERAARKILMERHNVRLHPPARWAPTVTGRAAKVRRRAGWVWRQVLRFTIGHGYEPWRILGLVIPLVAVLTFWFTNARTNDVLQAKGKGTTQTTDPPQASQCTSGYRCVQPLVLALDTVIPLVEFGQRSAWEPDQHHRGGRALAIGVWIATGLGWIFAALVASSFTQVTKKE